MDSLRLLPGHDGRMHPMEKSSFWWLAEKILDCRKNPGNDSIVMARSHELLAGFEGTDEGQPNQTQPNFWEQVTKAAEARAKELSNCSVTRCCFTTDSQRLWLCHNRNMMEGKANSAQRSRNPQTILSP